MFESFMTAAVDNDADATTPLSDSMDILSASFVQDAKERAQHMGDMFSILEPAYAEAIFRPASRPLPPMTSSGFGADDPFNGLLSDDDLMDDGMPSDNVYEPVANLDPANDFTALGLDGMVGEDDLAGGDVEAALRGLIRSL